MKMTKRVVAVLIAMMMLLTTMPLYAAAATEISAIEITEADLLPIIGDEVGSHLGYALPSVCDYTCGNHYWINVTDNESLQDTDIFEEGKTYKLCWWVKPNDGFEFASEPTVTINGQEGLFGEGSFHPNPTKLAALEGVYCITSIEFTAQAAQAIDEINIINATITATAGESALDTPDCDLPEDSHFTVLNFFWCDSVGSDFVGTFVEGDTYCAGWRLQADSGYVFDENAAVTINGSADNVFTAVTRIDESDNTLFYVIAQEFTAQEAQPINEIDILDATLTPVAGGSATDTLACDLPENCHFTVEDCTWVDEGGVPFTDTFGEGCQYHIVWTLKADAGYYFDSNAAMTLNGTIDNVDTDMSNVDSGDNTVFYVYSLPAEATAADIVINDIDITAGTLTPVAGESANVIPEISLPSDCHYMVVDCEWIDGVEGNSFTGNFVAGDSYCLAWTLEADSGYTFYENASVLINYSEDNVDTEYTGLSPSNDGKIFYVFSKAVKAGESVEAGPISITALVDEPYGGARANSVINSTSYNMPEDAVYSQNEYVLKSEDSDLPVTDWEPLDSWNDILETGVNYAAAFRFYLDPEVYPVETVLDEADITINGKAPDYLDARIDDGVTMVEFAVIYKNIKGLPELPYNLVVGDTIVTEANAADILGDGTASYDADTNTLTLTDCTLTKGYEWHTIRKEYANIFAYGDLNLCVKGTNLVETNVEDMSWVDGIYVKGMLTVCGDGTLTVIGDESGIYTDGGCDIFAEGHYIFQSRKDKGACIDGDHIRLYPNAAGATVTFKGDTQGLSAYNLDYYDFEVTGDGETVSYADLSKKELVFTAAANTDYKLFVGGVEVTETNKDDILGDGTASYDPDTKTLTLNNANISAWSTDDGDAAICSKKPLTVNLVGDNTIDMTGAGEGTNTWCAFIDAWWDLIVTGDGNLTLKMDSIPNDSSQYGMYAYYDLTVDIGGKLTISYGDGAIDDNSDVCGLFSGSGTLFYSAAETEISVGDSQYVRLLYGENGVILQNDGTFTAAVGKTGECYLLNNYNGDIEVTNTGDMTLTADVAVDRCIGIYSYGSLNIQNSGTLTVNAGGSTNGNATALYCWYDMTIESSKELNLTTGECLNGGSYAIGLDSYDNMLVFDCSGTVNLTAGKAASSSGIETYGSVLFGGDAKYTIISGEAVDGGASDGIYASCSVVIEDSADVTVKTGTAEENVYGICAAEVVVDDAATLSVEADNATSDEYGWSVAIEGWNSVTFNTSGDITVTAGKAGEYSVAILATTVTMSGSGNVTATADAADAASCAIRLYEAMEEGEENFIRIGGTAKDGKITLTGETAAVNFVPEFDDSAYEAKGNLTSLYEMTDISAEDMTACKHVVLTALEDVTPIIGDVLYGDANDDGAVNMKDVLAMRKQLAGMAVTIVDANADVNGDGSVNMKDVLQLRKFLAGLITDLNPAA